MEISSEIFLGTHFLICLVLQAIDHIINSAAKSSYMSAGQLSVPIVFRGPNGAAAGVGAQHSQVLHIPLCSIFFVSLSSVFEPFFKFEIP